MHHYPTTITDNAIAARNIVTRIVGRGCNYADGRKNGIRYKWLINTLTDDIINSVHAELIKNGIKNCNIMLHGPRYGTNGHAGISITVHA
jgi:hypothetical protein